MIVDYFKLYGNVRIIESQSEFLRIIKNNDEIRNIQYNKSLLAPHRKYRRLTIKDKTFYNVSFSFKLIKDIDFRNCSFENCLFISTHLESCKFTNCYFNNINPHNFKVRDCYLDPKSFRTAIPDIFKSNIALHLFQTLYDNASDRGIAKHKNAAFYRLKIWELKSEYVKFVLKKPSAISFPRFLYEFVRNSLFRSIGYGVNLPIFLFTTVAVFFILQGLNYAWWESYFLVGKDTKIIAFSPNYPNFISTLYYTFDCVTSLVDSQIQPKSDLGVGMVVTQKFIGTLLWGGLISQIYNRLIK